VIGDVAGHGLEAASAMAQIRTALRVVALTMHTPSEVLQQINRFLAVSASPVFATMLIVRCDPGSGACSAASAGHLPPVVCAEVPRVQWVTAGPPLGSGLSARYHDTSFILDADQTLLLYTDGLVERRGELLDDGLERLVSVLRCCEYDSGELADSIVSALCEPETTRDDVALLAVRRRGLSPELDLTLVADPARLSQVRMTIERWLSSVETEPSVLNDVVLAVSELATNVCLHAYPSFSRGPLHITGRVEGDDVHLIVRDEGRWRAEPSPHGGRGIPLLRALGFDVSFDRSDNGTAVRVIAARRPSQCEAI
jgi:anti-sigma regulatory factor (Ser/Thr protein kinase)